MKRLHGKTTLVTTYKTNLRTWHPIGTKKPKNCQKVWIIDSDDYGNTEYTFPAIYCLGYFIVKDMGVIQGSSHWKPRR